MPMRSFPPLSRARMRTHQPHMLSSPLTPSPQALWHLHAAGGVRQGRPAALSRGALRHLPRESPGEHSPPHPHVPPTPHPMHHHRQHPGHPRTAAPPCCNLWFGLGQRCQRRALLHHGGMLCPHPTSPHPHGHTVPPALHPRHWPHHAPAPPLSPVVCPSGSASLARRWARGGRQPRTRSRSSSFRR